jgi:HEAT repeat protein
LGDKQAVAPLLAKLNDQNANVRQAIIEALGQLGDKQAVAPLLAKLNSPEANIEAITAAALHTLGEPKGMAVLTRFLTSERDQIRRTAVGAYARYRDISDQQLLSRDLDALEPWLDPQEQVTEVHVSNASRRLNLALEQIRSRYEAMAVDLNLKLSWKG